MKELFAKDFQFFYQILLKPFFNNFQSFMLITNPFFILSNNLFRLPQFEFKPYHSILNLIIQLLY